MKTHQTTSVHFPDPDVFTELRVMAHLRGEPLWKYIKNAVEQDKQALKAKGISFEELKRTFVEAQKAKKSTPQSA